MRVKKKSLIQNFVKVANEDKNQKGKYNEIVFGAFYGSLIKQARKRIDQKIMKLQGIQRTILDDFEMFLLNILNNLCIRTLIYEMHICNQEGKLKGNDIEKYQYYIEHFLCDKEYLKDFFALYPVLERRINETIQNAIDIYEEVIQRINYDADELMEKFNIPKEKFLVIHMFSTFSDSHKNGRRVFQIEFVTGQKILYKPRSLKNEIKLQEIINCFYKLCGLERHEYLILDKENYGWCEIVQSTACRSINQLQRYYKRIGVILFINYILQGGDIHYENLIACNEYPVIIDAETFIGNIESGNEKSATEKISSLLRKSVLYSGILPFYSWDNAGNMGINMSAISGEEGQKYPIKIPMIINSKSVNMRVVYDYPVSKKNNNLAMLDDQFIEPREFAGCIIEGFKKAYLAAMQNTEMLLNIIQQYKELQIRHLVRNTQQYAILLNSSYHPELLMDGGARNLFLYSLVNGNLQNEKSRILIEDEISDLLEGDIPYFYFRCDERSLFTWDNKEEKGFFKSSALEQIQENIRNMSITDLREQIQYIKITFNMENAANIKIENKNLGTISGVNKLGIAEKMIKKLVHKIGAETIYSDDGTDVNWIGVKLCGIRENQWMIQALPTTLYDGIIGVDLVLHLYEFIYQDRKYNGIFKIIDKRIFDYIDNINKNKNSISGSSLGVFSGQGSILYMLNILYEMTGDPKYKEYFDKWLKCLETVIFEDKFFDLISGSSGIILVLINMYKKTKENPYLQKAIQIADNLISNMATEENMAGWKSEATPKILAGFAHGNSGFIEVFARLYEVHPSEKYIEIISRLLKYEDTLYSEKINNWIDLREFPDETKDRKQPVAWCHGAPGILLSRLTLYHVIKKMAPNWLLNQVIVDIRRAKDKLIQEDLHVGYCLCHGNMGNLLILRKYTEMFEDQQAKEICNHWFERIIGLFSTQSILPTERYNPGFMTGLSGIAYAMLAYTTRKLPLLIEVEGFYDKNRL